MDRNKAKRAASLLNRLLEKDYVDLSYFSNQSGFWPYETIRIYNDNSIGYTVVNCRSSYKFGGNCTCLNHPYEIEYFITYEQMFNLLIGEKINTDELEVTREY